MSKAADIYAKVLNGDFIPDDELMFAIEFFGDLATQLGQCGPVFKLAHNEAYRVYTTLADFRTARKRPR